MCLSPPPGICVGVSVPRSSSHSFSAAFLPEMEKGTASPPPPALELLNTRSWGWAYDTVGGCRHFLHCFSGELHTCIWEGVRRAGACCALLPLAPLKHSAAWLGAPLRPTSSQASSLGPEGQPGRRWKESTAGLPWWWVALPCWDGTAQPGWPECPPASPPQATPALPPPLSLAVRVF